MSIKRLEKIFELVLQYSVMKKGTLIDNHIERIKILEIQDITFNKSQDVYFSRRAIKHFVERRLEEFLVNNSPETSLQIMKNIVFSLERVFQIPDNVFSDKNGDDIIFERRSEHNNFIIRVVVENNYDGLDIKTIHPKQIKKLTTK